MRLLATIRPETRDPERYQCLRCGIWRVKKSGRSTRYCASLACRCGHPACPAAASWVPREGQARVIHLPEPRAT